MRQAINRMRFHGIRKLNWVERTYDLEYNDHLRSTGFDSWIDLSPLTIIIGPNSGGKSTVIDLFRALSDSRLWGTLPRENYPSKEFSGFDIEGASFKIKARFFLVSGKVLTHTYLELSIETNNIVITHSKEVPKFVESKEWKDPTLENLLNEFVGIQVRYLPASGPMLAQSLYDNELVKLLNELSLHFPTVVSNDGDKRETFHLSHPTADGIIGVLFKDDTGQHGNVHRDFLPLGWLQLVSVLSFLRNCKAGSLVLLDEPDRHLHPNLQRIMLKIISAEMEQKKMQVVIATHSSVLLNPDLLERYNAQVLVASRGRFSPLDDTRRLLDDLGVKSSDLVQANGIIWVEGPSDRIYIKTWLDLYAEENGLQQLIEGIHYSIVSYGGALIKHLTFSSKSPEMINLDALNHNWFIHIDSDLRNENQPLQQEKSRIFSEAEEHNRENHIWITQDYTIENYLPKPFDEKVLRGENGQVIVISPKVELARRFRKEITSWKESFKEGTDLPMRIQQLYDIIVSWQTPQEL